MARTLLAMIGLAVVLAALLSIRVGGGFHLGNVVAVVPIEGVITEADQDVATLDRLRQDDRVVGIVLRIDSPGGAVAPSQELYDAVWKLRDAKPVIASFGNVAASGGYYVGAAAHQIVAAPGTLTGSIGVIMEFRNLVGLAEKVGVGEEVVKSGRYKDIGHPLRTIQPDERRLLQGLVDDVLGQFVDAVARGRALDPERVRTLADGRIYSGQQAQHEGLVDELGGLERAVQIAWERAGQTGEPATITVRRRHWPWWLSMAGRWLGGPPRSLGGGLLFLYPGGAPG